MRSIINTKLIIALVLGSLLISSCSATKRRYNKGWHLDFFKGKSKKNKVSNNYQPKNFNYVHSMEEAIAPPLTKSQNLVHPHIPKSIVSNQANAEFSMVETLPKRLTKVSTLEQSINDKDRISKKASKKRSIKQHIKKELQNTAENESGSASRGIGILILVIGILVTLLASILIGVLLIILGIIVMRSGKKNTSAEPKESAMVDVVYLKNGSIIRGSIIEQIPNDQLKIQTKDGSIFVYKMGEISKITKERALK